MKKRRKRRSTITVPVASMGDIAFLLIIFFMVCSRLAQEGVRIDPPVSLDSVELENYPVIVAVDAAGAIYVHGLQVPDADSVEAVVRQALQGKTTEKQRTVLFRCDRAAEKRIFEPVIEAIARGGGIIAAVGETRSED